MYLVGSFKVFFGYSFFLPRENVNDVGFAVIKYVPVFKLLLMKKKYNKNICYTTLPYVKPTVIKVNRAAGFQAKSVGKNYRNMLGPQR